MVIARNHPILGHLRRFIGPVQVTMPDRDLLESYIQGCSETAFAGLVERHGPMVLGVCRAVLGHRDDAEDAFQATFLVLARKADSIRRRDGVGSWLHGVAYRIARKARAARARRQVLEAKATVPEPVESADDLSWAEVRAILHAELALLPERFREPLVLVYLEGLTQEDAARRLGWTTATVKGRVQRGRDRLRRRLERRGLGLTAALGATVTSQALSGPVPPALVEVAVRTGFALGEGTVSATIASLASAVVEPFIPMRLFGVAMVFFLSAAFAAGFAFWPREPAEPDLDASAAQPATPPMGIDRYGDLLPPGALARLGTVRWRQGDRVSTLVFSPDGRMLASAGHDETIRLWEVGTGREIARFPQPGRIFWNCLSMAFSPDGKTLVTGAENDLIRICDTKSGKEVRVLQEAKGEANPIAFSPNGKLMACCLIGSKIQVWDSHLEKLLVQFQANPGLIQTLTFSKDNQILASGGIDKVIQFWDVATGKEIFNLQGEEDQIGFLAFLPNGRTLVSGPPPQFFRKYPAQVKVWDLDQRKEIGNTLRLSRRNTVVALAPDGDLLAVGGRDSSGEVELLQMGTWKKVASLKGHKAWVNSLSFSPDGRILASAGSDQTIYLWDLATRKPINSLEGHRNTIQTVSFANNGNWIATASSKENIRVWETATGKEIRQFPGTWGSLAVDPTGTFLASADWKCTIWEMATGTLLCRWDNIHGTSRSAFSPDNKTFVSIDLHGGRYIFLNFEEKKEYWGRLRLNSTISSSITISPDCKYFASAEEKDDINFPFSTSDLFLWEVMTGKKIRQFECAINLIQSLAFSFDGKILASGHFDNTIRLWDVATGKIIRHYPAHQGSVLSLAFSPDGRMLVSGGEDKTVRLWEMATGKEKGVFSGHKGPVTCLAFSPDSRSLASGNRDTTVLVWDLTGLGRNFQKPLLPDQNWETLWRDLGDADAKKADRALWRMVAVPDLIIPILKKHLHPVSAADPKWIAQLIQELDHQDFAIRDQATRELEKLADLAEPALRLSLQGKPVLETQRRMENLLEKIQNISLPDQIRFFRAMEVLEKIGNPEARRILETLVKGTPESQITQDAKNSLSRLTKTSVPVKGPVIPNDNRPWVHIDLAP